MPWSEPVSQSVAVSVAAEREAFEEPERDLHPSARLEEVQSLGEGKHERRRERQAAA